MAVELNPEYDAVGDALTMVEGVSYAEHDRRSSLSNVYLTESVSPVL